MIFIDFEKAFDSVSWEFLFKILEAFNFGEIFLNWVKILYNEPLLSVTNNGYASQFFTTERGIRQGCPISALLFLLVVEALADKVRSSDKIQGIDIEGENITISQLADDTTLFLKDTMSIQCALKMLCHFENCAGLKLNKEKSEVIVLGTSIPIRDYICGLKITRKPIKTLGVWITKDYVNIPTINFDEKVVKLKHLLNMWKQRKLTLHGKITIVNSLALSQIMYVASVLYVPPEVITEVNKLIFSFLWPKKVHVKEKTIIAPVECGGLRMPNFEYKIKACKIMWIKRLLSRKKFTHIAKVFGLPLDLVEMCHVNYDVKFLKNYHSPFYSQVLQAWYDLQQLTCCTDPCDIRSQMIWLNNSILVDKQPLFVRSLYDKGLRYINDILDESGRFLQFYKRCNP